MSCTSNVAPVEFDFGREQRVVVGGGAEKSRTRLNPITDWWNANRKRSARNIQVNTISTQQ